MVKRIYRACPGCKAVHELRDTCPGRPSPDRARRGVEISTEVDLAEGDADLRLSPSLSALVARLHRVPANDDGRRCVDAVLRAIEEALGMRGR